ncbi:unnamed protein product [Haemonchus placei]|uniref:Protein SHOOT GRAVITROPISM 6 n=1 Tax=Haemonchus placei TaxID=6290 RepID=A0A0N4WNW1_HAEPC|nr:unnamed protein product [Haemonchus placei]
MLFFFCSSSKIVSGGSKKVCNSITDTVVRDASSICFTDLSEFLFERGLLLLSSEAITSHIEPLVVDALRLITEPWDPVESSLSILFRCLLSKL